MIGDLTRDLLVQLLARETLPAHLLQSFNATMLSKVLTRSGYVVLQSSMNKVLVYLVLHLEFLTLFVVFILIFELQIFPKVPEQLRDEIGPEDFIGNLKSHETYLSIT